MFRKIKQLHPRYLKIPQKQPVVQRKTPPVQVLDSHQSPSITSKTPLKQPYNRLDSRPNTQTPPWLSKKHPWLSKNSWTAVQTAIWAAENILKNTLQNPIFTKIYKLLNPINL